MKRRLFAIGAYLIIGLLVFVVFSHMRPLFSTPWDLIGRGILAAGLLTAALLLKNSKSLQDHWRPIYAFFVAVVAMAIDLYVPTREWLLALFRLQNLSVVGIALDKLESTMVLCGVILILTKVSGAPWSSLFLQKGKFKKSLIIGLIAFALAAFGSYFMAQLFGAVALTPARIVPWVPWILIFILGNSLNEELLFRGLFLKGMAKTIGPTAANLVLILPFVLHHTGVEYTNDALMFLVYLIPLAFFWGFITQKTDTLLGSILFHAGTDVAVILVLFSKL